MAHRLGLNEKKSNTHWLGILCYNEPMKRILTATLAFILSLSIFASVDWSGEYLWVNPTSKDNKGKCKELHFKVSTFTRYSFVIEDGKRKLKYTLGGDGLAKTGLFRNPVPQNEDKLTFVLTEI